MPTRLIPCFMVPDPQKKPMPVHASMVSIVIINSLIDYVICNSPIEKCSLFKING